MYTHINFYFYSHTLKEGDFGKLRITEPPLQLTDSYKNASKLFDREEEIVQRKKLLDMFIDRIIKFNIKRPAYYKRTSFCRLLQNN